jgi:hypothetical protein
MGPIAGFFAGAILPTLIGVVVSLNASTPGEFLTLRICAGFAGASIFFLTIYLLIKQDSGPWYWHYICGALVLASLALALPEIYSWIDNKQAVAQKAAERNFAYVDVASTGRGSGGVLIANKTGGSLPNVQIDIGTINSNTHYMHFYPFIPQDPLPLIGDDGKQVELPPGEYFVVITAQDGTFFEHLIFGFNDNKINRSFVVQHGKDVLLTSQVPR